MAGASVKPRRISLQLQLKGLEVEAETELSLERYA